MTNLRRVRHILTDQTGYVTGRAFGHLQLYVRWDGDYEIGDKIVSAEKLMAENASDA